MPEGDTIFRAARTLARVLDGETLTRVTSMVAAVERAGLAGHRVDRVEARGKNLLMHFDDSRVLYTHMRMTGSWHVYRHGEPWQKARDAAQVVLETERFVTVAFNAPVVELLSARQLARHPVLGRLGPDVLSKEFDPEEACRRMRAHPDLSLAEALLLQSALAGVGNVYKSEVLFLCRTDPFGRVADADAAGLRRIVDESRRLMARNLVGGARRTRNSLSGERTWVYGRKGRPCRRCGSEIRMRRHGAGLRSTYWCPSCQDRRDG
jgi:endonuclease-8